MTSTNGDSPRCGRPVSSISLASSSTTTASARTARKSWMKMHDSTPTAMKPAIMYGLNAEKSAMGSMFTFQTNHAVPSSISATPTAKLRGNLRAAAASCAGLARP